MRPIPDAVLRLAAHQDGLLARAQLRQLGFDADRVRSQITAQRWALRSPTVISTFTGQLTREQLCWLGVLHAGGPSLVGGYTALERHGLRHWPREHVTILIDDDARPEPVAGIRFLRTRRPLDRWRSLRAELPVARVEPAALLTAGYESNRRTAQGLLAAVVQQGLTTPADLMAELPRMRPLRWSRLLRAALTDIGEGAGSVAEIDVRRMCRRFGLPPPRRQVRRRDSAGRRRFTDCEWRLPDGSLLVLEVDGAFHMDAEHWEEDLARQRRLSGPGRTIVRCTARELRDEPEAVAADLQALGLAGRGTHDWPERVEGHTTA
jgi:hypothetical protein